MIGEGARRRLASFSQVAVPSSADGEHIIPFGKWHNTLVKNVPKDLMRRRYIFDASPHSTHEGFMTSPGLCSSNLYPFMASALGVTPALMTVSNLKLRKESMLRVTSQRSLRRA